MQNQFICGSYEDYFDIYLLEECKYDFTYAVDSTDHMNNMNNMNNIVKYKEMVRQKMLNTVMHF